MANITHVLSKYHFKYHKCPKEYYSSFVIEDLKIVNIEPLIEYITVSLYGYAIHINFNDIIPKEPNFGLSFDVSDYIKTCPKYITRAFGSENNFINELQRLNLIGLNIKGVLRLPLCTT